MTSKKIQRKRKRKRKPKNYRRIVAWLQERIEEELAEAECAENMADEYQKALDQFRTKGTLPRETRQYYERHKDW